MRSRILVDSDNFPSETHLYNASLISKYLHPGSRILDVGCWTGQLYAAFDEKPKYYGLDVSRKSIQRAKKNYSEDGVKFVVASATKLPFMADSFDVVVLMDVIEHLPGQAEKRVLGEIKRVLKPGGTFVLSTPHKNLLSIISDPAYFLENHRHYARDEMEKMVVGSGFHIESNFVKGGVFHVSYYLTDMIFKHIMWKRMPNYKIFKSWRRLVKWEYKKLRGFLALYVIAKK